MRWWSVTQWLIAVNIVIYLADLLSGGRITAAGAFSAEYGIYHLQIWRFFTYAFIHADAYHILFNLCALWIFGPPVELRLRGRGFLCFYLLSGLGGVIGYLLLWRLDILHTERTTQLVGASACIYGCMVGAATVAPGQLIRFLFPPISVRMRTLAWICIGLTLVAIATRGRNAGGEAAHLGGAAAGFVLIRNIGWFGVLSLGRRPHRFWRPGDPASNFFRNDV